MRGLAHYIATAVIMPVYGIQVCPFIEDLTAWQVAIPIFVALTVQYGLRGGWDGEYGRRLDVRYFCSMIAGMLIQKLHLEFGIRRITGPVAL